MVAIKNAKSLDIVLFKNPDFNNTNSIEVGYMGLITSNDKCVINFIHSTSGKAMSVAITPYREHYKK